MSDLFARVRPLVGEALAGCQVAVVGSSSAALLVEYLVACGVRRWLAMAGNAWLGALLARLARRYGAGLDLALTTVVSVEEMAAADLVLAVDAGELARGLPCTVTRLAIDTLAGSQASRGVLALPGETLHHLAGQDCGTDHAAWDWLVAAPLMALWARALLLRGTAFYMAAWEDAWTKGLRVYAVGVGHDPTVAVWPMQDAAEEVGAPSYDTPLQRKGTLLIVGLGSLGSVAAQQLAPWVERVLLVDPDQVEIVNLVRQAYSQQQVGQPKAVALADSLRSSYPGLACEPVVMSLCNEREVADLLRAYGVTAALVTTGTQADFAIARALRVAAIPHVVGRCYARGRYWEGVVVDGAAGLSYEQVRREVAAGPVAAPTPEQIASYGAGGELAGEPATAMETGWAALWLARLTAQMMAPSTLREGWMLARLAADATCFIGGLALEQGEQGAAYGITVPGQVHAWSVAQIEEA